MFSAAYGEHLQYIAKITSREPEGASGREEERLSE